ncbi:ion-transporting P-type ATPase [Blattamonas nauphoetae]|uniref:Phospholipid-transporting ATPase n=1 Tax=Blattamonas nauphoetae TaxID=2049346 RepID=A0ABQ9XZT8_9EUKA|nr:ion-transporting P-type ATPase [Blattamonas nauphoetae]
MDCSPFLNWMESRSYSFHSKVIVFQSLVVTLKSQPALDDSLEAQAVKFLKSVKAYDEVSADAFLSRLATLSGDSSTHLVQCIMVLISSGSQILTTAAIKMLSNLLLCCSDKNVLLLIKADLISELIMTLHPLSLSFTEAVDIHINLLKTIAVPLWLATPYHLAKLGIDNRDEQQAVHKTVFQQVLAHLEKYIMHLCVNRYSIVDGNMSIEFMFLIALILRICPYYQPTMDFVLHMPVVLTIPSCLAFFEDEASIEYFLLDMNNFQLDLNKTRREEQQMWQTVHGMLRMEGIEDVIEGKLQNDRNAYKGTPENGKNFVRNTIRTSKYHWWNFIFKNLLEQFRHASNIYFLLIAIVNFLPGLDIFQPLNSLLPFVFIVVITMIKDAFEDILRHITDNKTNTTPVSVFTDTRFVTKSCQDICVGDLVYVSQDEEIPADLIILATSGTDGICYVNTMNLDGEANLKTKRANLSLNSFLTSNVNNESSQPVEMTIPASPLNQTTDYAVSISLSTSSTVSDEQDPETPLQAAWKVPVAQLQGEATVQPPSRSLVDFTGRLKFSTPSNLETIPIDDNQLLLKGCTLKNTEAVVGLTVFTGQQSKIQLNSQGSKAKMSRLEWRLNTMVVVIFIVNVVFVIITGKTAEIIAVSAMAIDTVGLAYLIPISLFVSIEFARIITKCFMEKDRRMRGRKTEDEEDIEMETYSTIRKEIKAAKKNKSEYPLRPRPAEDPIEAGHMVCRTSSLNEELGMVEHIFTDKTGTLTQNKMVFKRCSLGPELFQFNSVDDPAQLHKLLEESNASPFPSDSNRTPNPIISPLALSSSKEHHHSPTDKGSELLPHETISPLPDLKTHLEEFLSTEGGKQASFLQIHNGQDQLPSDNSRASLVKNSTFHFVTALLLCHDALPEQIDFEREEQERLMKLKQQATSVADLLLHRSHSKTPTPSHRPTAHPPLTTSPHSLALSASTDNIQIVNESETQTPIFRFQSTSPDDIAFLNMLQASGFTFSNRTTESLSVTCAGSTLQFQILAALPFTSARRRMSVLVKCPDGVNRLYIKGADSTILPMCIGAHVPKDESTFPKNQKQPQLSDTVSPEEVFENTVNIIDDLSRGGFRTLCVCQREITQDELNEWLPKFKSAELSIDDRASKIESAFVELESKGMNLIGCTGVEDKLQDGCAETIDYFIKAGVRVWILTGDKVDTAVNIAFSCQLLKQNTLTHYLTSDTLQQFIKEHPKIAETLLEGSESVAADQRAEFTAKLLIEIQLVRLLKQFGIERSKWISQLSQKVVNVLDDIPHATQSEEAEERETAMIVDGWCVHNILQSDSLMDLFILVTDKCDGVVCCRIAPIQKALIVRMVKVKRNKVCLAIGDGANDVSMIQEAHVGVGIQGLEGLNASQNADYSIAQFRFLKRLCAVHGHFNMNRFANLIKYSFLKNMIFTTVLFVYQFTNGFSQQICFEDWFGTLFNLVFTSIPIMAVVLTDKDVPDWVMLKCPALYRIYRNGRDLNLIKIVGWPVTGVIIGISFSFLIQWVFGKGDLVTQGGKMGQYDHYIGIVDTSVLALVTLIVMWFSNFWSGVFLMICSLSFGVYLLVMLFITAVRPISPLFHFTFFHLWTSPVFYLSFFVTLIACFVPFTIISSLRRRFFPTARDKALSSFNPQLKFSHVPPPSLKNVKYIRLH